jgi:hypothetical protein
MQLDSEFAHGMLAVYADEASDCQVQWGSNDDPRQHLVLGQAYTVSAVDVRSWHTKLSFEECPGKRFNSVNFRPQEGGSDVA